STETELSSTQSKLKSTETELSSTQSTLKSTETELSSTQSNLMSTETELSSTQSTLKSTETELSSTQSKLKSTETELSNTQSKLNNTETKLSNTQSKLYSTETELGNTQDKLDVTSSQLATYEDQFGAEQHAFNRFQQLSDSSHTGLKGIFKDHSPSGFLACGLQEKNILSFWDYCKNRLIENPDQEAEQLTELFNFFFQRYLLAYPNTQIQNVPLGERFDPIAHIRTPRSPVSGNVSRVVLAGWINCKTKKIIKSTLVEI
ncbi:MAG: hypothetical protein Q9N68_09620, partial [Gammaproteobacteria bacterium]|nr:hypothetical protein [Gammaproteobacteria bacterium]